MHISTSAFYAKTLKLLCTSNFGIFFGLLTLGSDVLLFIEFVGNCQCIPTNKWITDENVWNHLLMLFINKQQKQRHIRTSAFHFIIFIIMAKVLDANNLKASNQWHLGNFRRHNCLIQLTVAEHGRLGATSVFYKNVKEWVDVRMLLIWL